MTRNPFMKKARARPEATRRAREMSPRRRNSPSTNPAKMPLWNERIPLHPSLTCRGIPSAMMVSPELSRGRPVIRLVKRAKSRTPSVSPLIRENSMREGRGTARKTRTAQGQSERIRRPASWWRR